MFVIPNIWSSFNPFRSTGLFDTCSLNLRYLIWNNFEIQHKFTEYLNIKNINIGWVIIISSLIFYQNFSKIKETFPKLLENYLPPQV